MNKTRFYAGNKVYCPELGTDIYILVTNVDEYCPIAIRNPSYIQFTNYGYLSDTSANPSIFLATEENRLKLNKFYGKEFQQEIPVNTVIKHNLEYDSYCLCLASNEDIEIIDNLTKLKQNLVVITEIPANEESPYISTDGRTWRYVQPIEIGWGGNIKYLTK